MPLYSRERVDIAVSIGMVEHGTAERDRLLDQAHIRSGHRVLDVGCGTGSLTIQLKRLNPETDIVGLDPDPKALALAKRKAARAAVSIQLDQGFGDELPYPDGSFDRVLSSLMFHHVPTDEKGKTLRAVRASLNLAASFTCSISKRQRRAHMAC